MKQALFGLIGTVILVVGIITLALLLLRTLGGQQRYSAMDTPILRHERYHIFDLRGNLESSEKNRGTEPYLTQSQIQNINAQLPPDVFFRIHLRVTHDGVWFLYPFDFLQHSTNKKGRPEVLSASDLSDIVILTKGASSPAHPSHLLTFDDYLKSFPHRPLFLEIHSASDQHLQAFIDSIEKSDFKAHMMVNSQYKPVIHGLKKLRPRWVYGIDTPSLTAAGLMAGLFLEPLASLKCDFVVVPVTDHGVQISERLKNELTKREKLLIYDYSHGDINRREQKITEKNFISGTLSHF